MLVTHDGNVFQIIVKQSVKPFQVGPILSGFGPVLTRKISSFDDD
jgi:hypothetical protein